MGYLKRGHVCQKPTNGVLGDIWQCDDCERVFVNSMLGFWPVGAEKQAMLLASLNPKPPEKLVVNGSTSDGFHTFDELYEHRMRLNAAWFKAAGRLTNMFPWRALNHHDGEVPFGGGWFIVGIDLPDVGQITYHYPNEHWDVFDMPEIRTLENAPEFDGHTSADVLQRLAIWAER